jgi:hypothetical protein
MAAWAHQEVLVVWVARAVRPAKVATVVRVVLVG